MDIKNQKSILLKRGLPQNKKVLHLKTNHKNHLIANSQINFQVEIMVIITTKKQ